MFCVNVDAAIIGNIPAGWTIDAIASYNADCNNNRYTPIPDANFEQALIDLGIDSGTIDNHRRGIPLGVLITFPDGQSQNFAANLSNNGNYRSLISINSDSCNIFFHTVLTP